MGSRWLPGCRRVPPGPGYPAGVASDEADPYALLQRMPIFGGVSREALGHLLAKARAVKVSAGDCFFREGDPGGSAFALEAGRALAVKAFRGGEVPLLELGPGDCFGEVALLYLGARSGSVRALEDCAALELTARALYGLSKVHVDQFALIYMNLGRELSRRLRRADERLFRAKLEVGELAASGYEFVAG
jgi:CRP/FNR family cyclic AMP-dependent transcriptional regulator